MCDVTNTELNEKQQLKQEASVKIKGPVFL